MFKFWVWMVIGILSLSVVTVGTALAVRYMLPVRQLLYGTKNLQREAQDQDIYLLDVDRRWSERVKVDGDTGNAIWSPDGNSIAFTQDTPNYATLYIMDAYRQKPVAYTEPYIKLNSLVWSPDGKRIAFKISDGSMPLIGILDIATAETSLIPVPFNFIFGPPIWSPDGQWLIYAGVGERENHLFALACSAEGCENEFHPMLESLAVVSLPQWSPDGRQMALVVQADPSGKVLFYRWAMVCSNLLDADCFQNMRAITQESVTSLAGGFRWSFDIQQVVFTMLSLNSSGNSIHLIDAPTGQQQQLVQSGDTAAELTWFPDGRELAYIGANSQSGTVAIHILNLYTGDTQVVADGAGFYPHNLMWRP